MPTNANTNRSPTATPFRERLLPMLWRYSTHAFYRKSRRFARYRKTVGAERVEHIPSLRDQLAAWLSQRLPASLVSRLDVGGLQRTGDLLAKGIRALASPFGRGARSPQDLHPLKAPKTITANVTFANTVLLRGYLFANNQLHCHYQLLASVTNSIRFAVRMQSDPAQSEASPRHRDHEPRVPVSAWPRDRLCTDTIDLTDLLPGDYRIELSLIDATTSRPLPIYESGQAAIDLGWFRVKDLTESVIADAAR